MVKKYLIALLISLLSEYSYAEGSDTPCTGNIGEIAACHLNKAYNSTPASCSSGSFAGLCSGVVLRATALHSERKHRSWDIPPQNSGVSFSYLRKDSNFGQLAYDHKSGFIFTPVDRTPPGQTKVHIRCGFPFDGDTIKRSGMCGQNRQYIESKPCDQLSPPVVTSEQWVNQFIRHNSMPDSDRYSCGFTLEKGISTSPAAFLAMLKSRNDLIRKYKSDPAYFISENELVLAKWEPENVNAIPIEAFFYIAGSQAGLESAQADQEDFYNDSNKQRVIPVIEIKLPITNDDTAKFNYYNRDQKIK